MLPEVKRVIREVSFAEAREWADKAATMATAVEVRRFMEPIMAKRFADLLGESPGDNGHDPDESARVHDAMTARAAPYDGSWQDWRPDPRWPVPALPADLLGLVGTLRTEPLHLTLARRRDGR